MRISDWSSDVCSSDLEVVEHDGHRQRCQRLLRRSDDCRVGVALHVPAQRRGDAGSLREAAACQRGSAMPAVSRRSEEHTSELQSLMRISYAVFCLKKTNTERLIPFI